MRHFRGDAEVFEEALVRRPELIQTQARHLLPVAAHAVRVDHLKRLRQMLVHQIPLQLVQYEYIRNRKHPVLIWNQ